MSYPKLRYIDAFPIEEQGQARIVISDPQNLTGRVLAVSREAFSIVAMLNGENSITAIQSELYKRFGELVPSETIESVIQTLDESFFLDNEKFREHYQKLIREFKESPVRKPSCAGGSYPDDPEELRNKIYEHFESSKTLNNVENRSDRKPIKAFISPHIDYTRGGQCYAQVYQYLSETEPVDIFVILGTGHAGSKGNYVFTKKDFETPLGIIETDRDFIDCLESKLGMDLCEEEFIHKAEHSIELQLIFIQLIYPRTKWPKIVPILCGGFHEAVIEGKVPSEIFEVEKFLSALKETIEKSSKRICVIASADLSHVGPRFGDEERAEGKFLERIQMEDLEMLNIVQKLQPEDFFRHVQKDNDRRRVCGLASIYTLLSVTDVDDSELIKYSQATDPSGDQAVTFCGITFR